MNHQDAADWIFDLHTGRLSGDLQSEVSAHVEDCRSCLRLLAVFDGVADATRREAEYAVQHPDSKLVVLRVVQPETLTEAQRDEVDGHLSNCEACAAETEAVREAEREFQASAQSAPKDNVRPFERRPQVSAPSTASWRGYGMAASGIAAALLVAFGYVAFWKLPMARSEIAQLQQGSAAGVTPGVMSLPLFSGALRDGAEGVVLSASSGLVPVAVAPSLPQATGEGVPHEFNITDARARSVFSLELESGEIRRLAGDSGVLALLVPGASIPPGTYTLMLTDLEQDAALLERKFRVEVKP